MPIRTLFATRLYEAMIDDQALLGDLAYSIRMLADDDVAGQRWSRDKGYKGYTSYASLNDLPRRDPAFEDLKRILTRHAAAWRVSRRCRSAKAGSRIGRSFSEA